jgi:hypothetical protein
MTLAPPATGLFEAAFGGARPRVGMPPFAPQPWEATGGSNAPTTPETLPVKHGLAAFIERMFSPTNALGQFGQALMASSGGPIGNAMGYLMQSHAAQAQKGDKFNDWKQQYDYEVAHPKDRAPTGFAADMQMAGIDPNSEEGRNLAHQRVMNLVDPTVTYNNPDVGSYYGPQSGLQGVLARVAGSMAPPAQAPQGVLGAELPPGWKIEGGAGGNAGGGFPGMVTPGNIDIHNRPIVRNRDGSISTVRSMSFGTDQGEVLVPTVSDDGHILTDDQAIDLYRRTGKHLGIFRSPAEATAFAKSLHEQQADEYLPRAAGGFGAFKNAIIGQESGGRYGVPNAEGSGAMGVGQVMPETAKALAARIGLQYRPELMSGSDAPARQYQDAITNAALQEAWQVGRGDPRTAAMYYHGGSNRNIWGPKTLRYAGEVLARMGAR